MFYPKEMQNRQKTFSIQPKNVCKRQAIFAKIRIQDVTKHSQKNNAIISFFIAPYSMLYTS